MVEQSNPRLFLTDLSKGWGWAASLRDTPLDWRSAHIQEPSDVRFILEESEGHCAVVILGTPTREIVRSLAGGESPSTAVATGEDSVQDLVDLKRRFGARLILADSIKSEADSIRVLESVEAVTGVSLGATTDLPAIKQSGGSDMDEDAGLRLAALQLLGMSGPQELLASLDSVGAQTSDDKSILDLVEDLMSSRPELTSMSERLIAPRSHASSPKTQIDGLEKELKTTILQLHRTQEHLEKYIVERRGFEQKIANMRRGRASRKARIAELEEIISKQQKSISALRRGRDYRKSKISNLENMLKEQSMQVAAVEQENLENQNVLFSQQTEMELQNEKIKKWLRFVRDQHRKSARDLSATLRKLTGQQVSSPSELRTTNSKSSNLRASKLWSRVKRIRRATMR